MSLDLTEPDNTLVASVWAEVDLEYPSLTLGSEPTEQEMLDHAEREELRSSEFSSRYQAQRQAAIDADRLTLSQDEQDRLAAWDTKPQHHLPTGKYSKLGAKEAKLREWVTNDITRESLLAKKIWDTNYDFIMEFTKAERKSLRKNNNDDVGDLWVQITTWQGDVHSDDPRIVGGLDLIEALGIITPERRAEILSKE